MTEPLFPNDPLKAAWRSQPVEPIPLNAMALAAGASRFERRVRRRNLIEYAAGAVAVPAFGTLVVLGHHGWMMRAGAGLVVLGLVFILWQLNLQASPSRVPLDGSAESLLAFQRAQLARQRDALRGVPIWYLLPVVPGMTLMSLGRWVQDHNPRLTLAQDHGMILIGDLIVVLVLAIIWLINALGAARLDREIDRIDRLQGG